MKRLLRDRLLQTIAGSILLCILLFAGVIGYQRWRFVQRAYAEAARFGYTEENFLAAEEHCGDPWIFFIPPPSCYLTIYFTTDLTRDQLIQVMLEQRLFGPKSLVRNGSPLSASALIGDINTYSGKRFTIDGSTYSFAGKSLPGAEDWGFSIEERRIAVIYWRINPQLVYEIDGKRIVKNILAVGLKK